MAEPRRSPESLLAEALTAREELIGAYDKLINVVRATKEYAIDVEKYDLLDEFREQEKLLLERREALQQCLAPQMGE